MKYGLILSMMLFSFQTLADMAPEILIQSEDMVVIEEAFTADLTLEDPVFSSRKSEREVAALIREDVSFQERDLSGELSVQKEIPYSYPSITRHRIEGQVLAELEEKEKKSQ